MPLGLLLQIYRAYERYGQEVGVEVKEDQVKAAAEERRPGGTRGFAASAVAADDEDASGRTQRRS